MTMHFIGPYTLKRMLGKGAFGEVYLASKERKEYALKRLIQGAPHIKERFFKEATRVERLRRTHRLDYIVEIHDVMLRENAYVMEYLPEGSREYWGRSRDAEFIPRLAHAVGRLHGAQVVHRDLKPDNIRARGTVPVLIDFGIASWQDGATALDTAIGTPAYSPPESILHASGDYAAARRAAAQLPDIPGADRNEQIRNAKKLHDVYSLGMSVGCICTGTLPFTKNDYADFFRNGDTTRRQAWLRKLPEPYSGFVKDSTAFYPLDRPFIDDLIKTYFSVAPVGLSAVPQDPGGTDELPSLCLSCGELTQPPAARCGRCGSALRYLSLGLVPSGQTVRMNDQQLCRVLDTDEAGNRRDRLFLPLGGQDAEYTVGRDPAVHLAFPDDHWQSRRHGRFVVRKNSVLYCDGLDGATPKNPSRYDTYLVGASGVALRTGGHLLLGSTLCVIQRCFGDLPAGAGSET